MNLISLQFKTTNNFQTNLSKLLDLINDCEQNSFILAPELCLSGYSYDCLNEASLFTTKAIEVLKELSINKTISLTMITKVEEQYFNTLYIFSKNKIIHTQSKLKLFSLGEEEKHFTSGNINDIKIIEIDGLKIASLICFELRFIELWSKIKGVDIILIPAMWGKLRKQNFLTLTNALAITNQCYVIASDSCNDDMASSSGVINPFGIENRDDGKEIISMQFDSLEIKKMRRYLDIGNK